MTEINTKRLTITSMTKLEMTELINSLQESVPELSTAYREMLDGCVANPEEYVWYCAWKILLTDSAEQVGSACFKGFNNGAPEIGYGINDEHCNMGYATEAVAALCKWAFLMPGVVAVTALTEPDNEQSKRVLAKSGFMPTKSSEKDALKYILVKSQ